MIDRDEDGKPEPFFAESLPCESCGKPCEERQAASWDMDLLVGDCCRVEWQESGIPYEPRCLEEYAVLMAFDTVGEMVDAVRKHRASCAVCQGARKGMGKEGGRIRRAGAA